ncbi:NAD-binding protein [Amorphoplanes nipponensis]|uniref:Potassium transporter TrkA n=1 Tax=Actinoplanes nipponensis TaxID=135950 RepID=A0A919JM62_9ACTN|nr:NAD-binding protein [Actinoplanes nipponensis]GIE49344.1 potassium transporter TrkA [Actinoplanes nipponensis]
MAVEPVREPPGRSLVSRLRRTGDARPHFVICGADPLVYTVAEELANAGHRIRLTVIVPARLRADVPDLATLRGVRVIRADRLDERAFRAAGLTGAAALALVMPDDVVNLHAALCAQAVEPDLRLVIRMFNTGLGYGVRRLFADCAVLSDAAMAAPAFVAASLGEVAPTHVRLAGRTLYLARRADVRPEHVVCALTAADGAGRVDVLPAEPAPELRRPADLVLAEATGRPAGQAVAAQRLVRARRRRRPLRVLGRAVRAALSRKLGIAVLATLIVTVVSGAVLVHADPVNGFWKSIYVTLLTAVGSSDVEINRNGVAQAAQLVLTIAGLALLPLITAAVVEGMVNARLALSRGTATADYEDHIVVVGLGNVGTRVLRQLVDLGLQVVAIDRAADARGAKIAEQLGVPFIVGDAAREETLRAASIGTSKALVVLSTDDVTNLQAALNARAVRPDLRVVLRLFDDDFARRVQTAFSIDISRSVSRLAAPAFAAAMLDRDVLATIPVDRHALLVASVQVHAGSPLDGGPLSRADRPLSVRVIGLAAAGKEWVDWTPDARRVLTAGDRVMIVARRAGLRALVEQATPPAEPMLLDDH